MRILCFGDSNTYGYDPRSCFGGQYPACIRWVDVLAHKTGYKTINAGENGREIPVRESNILRFDLMLKHQAPIDLLIVMLGSNDLLQGNSVPTVVRRMEYFLQQIKLDPSDILLIAPPPMQRGEWVPTDRLVSASRELSHAYQALCGRLCVHFANAEDWDVPLTFDGVHFTEEGHRAFAEGLTSYLTKEFELCWKLV